MLRPAGIYLGRNEHRFGRFLNGTRYIINLSAWKKKQRITSLSPSHSCCVFFSCSLALAPPLVSSFVVQSSRGSRTRGHHPLTHSSTTFDDTKRRRRQPPSSPLDIQFLVSIDSRRTLGPALSLFSLTLSTQKYIGYILVPSPSLPSFSPLPSPLSLAYLCASDLILEARSSCVLCSYLSSTLRTYILSLLVGSFLYVLCCRLRKMYG